MDMLAVVQPKSANAYFMKPQSVFSAIVKETLRSPGQPLDLPTRTFMESGLGHDFTQVRVHTDEKASLSARAINALAYTVGSHIAVRNDKYAPHTPVGRSLLAHELAHVVQQSKGQGGSEPESRAAVAARTVMNGQRIESELAGTASLGVYRQHDPDKSDEEFVKLLLQSMRTRDKRSLIPPASPFLGGASRYFLNYKQPILPWVKPGLDLHLLPPESPLLDGSSRDFLRYKPEPIPSWVKRGLDLHLPREKSEKPKGLGFNP